MKKTINVTNYILTNNNGKFLVCNTGNSEYKLYDDKRIKAYIPDYYLLNEDGNRDVISYSDLNSIKKIFGVVPSIKISGENCFSTFVQIIEGSNIQAVITQLKEELASYIDKYKQDAKVMNYYMENCFGKVKTNFLVNEIFI